MSVRQGIVEGVRPVGRAPSGVLLGAGMVAALPALAVLYLVIRASEADSGTWNLILRDRTAWLALRSLGLTAAVTAGAILLGVPLAWLVTRTDLPLRRVWTVVLALPLVIP
ncbi:MAG: iron ABC transporter permease, partial [Actinomycetota bacterium]